MSESEPTLHVSDGDVIYGGLSLPPSEELHIGPLAGSLQHVTNSYKFYWLLSLLEAAKELKTPIVPMNWLLSTMLKEVWYPVNHFRLNFGKQDRFSQLIARLREESALTHEASGADVTAQIQGLLEEGAHPKLRSALKSLLRYVPYRFLRPWFSDELKGMKDSQVKNAIIDVAQQHSERQNPAKLPVYTFSEELDAIVLTSPWRHYLQRHYALIRGFCMWKLVRYLQARNPHVPGISEKLSAPETRKLQNAKRFWERVTEITSSPLRCIYSNQLLEDAYAIDHFLPWSYVAHDLMWNLTPIPPSINSSKRDGLPSLPKYFQPLADQQYDAIQLIGQSPPSGKHGHEGLLEDHIIMTKVDSVSSLLDLPKETFAARLHDNIAPQIQIARNMGFSEWEYTTP